ncbi:MAG: hypothetical protein AB8G23_11950 [Myxococcota bacterium]
MQTLRTFVRIIDLKMIIVIALALGSTYVSIRFGVLIDMPLELIGIAIVFPIVFSISQAFTRREAALTELAEFKSNLVAIVLAHRDWPETKRSEDSIRIQGITVRLYSNVQEFLREDRSADLNTVYDAFSGISKSNEILRREVGVPPNEIARLNQHLKIAMTNFEKLRNIAVYRTPRSLRAFTGFFLSSFPILFGPYFAFLSSTSFPAVGYCVAVIYTVVLVGLDHIQEDLENPYDGIGVDDIDFGGESTESQTQVNFRSIARG